MGWLGTFAAKPGVEALCSLYAHGADSVPYVPQSCLDDGAVPQEKEAKKRNFLDGNLGDFLFFK